MRNAYVVFEESSSGKQFIRRSDNTCYMSFDSKTQKLDAPMITKIKPIELKWLFKDYKNPTEAERMGIIWQHPELDYMNLYKLLN